jgi:2-keto-3-deoxy-L-rhamnonate aldolase RhmA
MNEENGTTKTVPCIAVAWDAESQQVAMKFDPLAFKTWDMVLAVLEMAKRQAEQSLRVQQAQMMQQAMLESQQAENIRRNLRR